MFVALGLGFVALALVLLREQRHLRNERKGLLAPALPLLQEVRSGTAPDGFPWASGTWNGRRVVLRVVPDLSILRRLPQLWLVIHLPGTGEGSSFVVTARPRGEEFISDSATFPHSIDVPDWLPRDSAVRLGGTATPAGIEPLRDALSNLFTDARLKEVSALPSGCRLVYQMAEGDRGSHLIGRQARFKASLPSHIITRLLTELARLQAQMPTLSHKG